MLHAVWLLKHTAERSSGEFSATGTTIYLDCCLVQDLEAIPASKEGGKKQPHIYRTHIKKIHDLIF